MDKKEGEIQAKRQGHDLLTTIDLYIISKELLKYKNQNKINFGGMVDKEEDLK
eukprot:Pgem_evm1s18744